MATTVQRYVNPASVGGDGTTDALTGANAAYAGIDDGLAAEFAVRPNLVTNDEILKFTYKGGTDQGFVQCSTKQFTTDTTRYVWIDVDMASRHLGVYDNTKARLAPTDTPAYGFQNVGFNLRVDGLQISPTAGLANNPVGIGLADNTTTGYVYVRNCIFKPTSTTGTPTGGGAIVSTGSSGGRKVDMLNCLVDGFYQIVQMNFMSGTAKLRVYHCTGVNQYKYGIQATDGGSGRVVVKNNRIATPGPGTSPLAFRLTSTTPTSAGNYTGDATSPDGASFQNKTFTWAGASDYHIVSGDTFTGADLSADPEMAVQDDVDGDSRTAYYSGFDEYVAAGPTYYSLGTITIGGTTSGGTGGGALIDGGLVS